MSRNLSCGLAALFLVPLACRPVIAIGWNEFMIFFLLFLILLGPPLYAFFQRLNKFRKWEKKDKSTKNK